MLKQRSSFQKHQKQLLNKSKLVLKISVQMLIYNLNQALHLETLAPTFSLRLITSVILY